MTDRHLGTEDVLAALRGIVEAWEALPGGEKYTPLEVSAWLLDDMKPAIEKARAILSPHRWVDATPLVRWPHCSTCGTIKRLDGRNSKVCKGAPKVSLREVRRG